MIPNPGLILYTCISNGTTVLADFNPEDCGLEALALQCLEKAPPHHSVFSHTTAKRTYMFSIDGPFAHFAIFKEDLARADGLWFLNRIKGEFKAFIKSKSITCFDNLASRCFQCEFNPILCELLAPPPISDGQNGKSVSKQAKKIVTVTLLGKTCKVLKKKKRSLGGNESQSKEHVPESKVLDVMEFGGESADREFVMPLHKNGLYGGDGGRPKAKQKWRQHLLMVLLLDFFGCCLMLVIWLYICRGFKCIAE